MTDPLHANDRDGVHPPSWYAATAEAPPPSAPLRGEIRADACVIGAGFTGLSAALHLAQRGLETVVIDAHRMGFGASGRNGGQLGSGQRRDQAWIERVAGPDDARRLWDLAEDAKALAKSLIETHRIDCHLKPGVAHFGFTRREVAQMHAEADHLAERYGYERIEKLDRDAGAAICPSPRYAGGTLDTGAGHLHPLAYALGLGRAAIAAGARVFEGTKALRIEAGHPVTVQTDAGRIVADHAVLACNGYLGHLESSVAARVMPINNFIAATAPLGADAARVLARDVAVADTRFVVNYFRLSHDGRLLFGGGESYGVRFPRDIAAVVRKPMTEIFPHLRDMPIDYAWGGTLAITMRRMPHFARPGPGVLSASGYSGHGVAMATLAGRLMADAIGGEAKGFDTMARIPARRFPGGTALRKPLLALAMTWYSMRDRLGV